MADSPHLISGRVQTLFEQAEFWAELQNWPRARRLLLQAIEWDAGVKARLKYAAFLHQLGEETEAIGQLSLAWEFAKHHNQPQWIAAICEHLAVIHRDRNEWAVAKSFQQQAISARLRAQGEFAEDHFRPGDFLALANDAISQGDLEFAELLVKHALRCPETQESPAELADAWGTRGTIALLKHRPNAAWRCFLKAYFFHCRAQDAQGRLMDLLNLAAAGRELGWWELTVHLLLRARKEAGETRHPRLMKKVEHFLEEAHRVLAVASRAPEWN